jgi:hypothetical protein
VDDFGDFLFIQVYTSDHFFCIDIVPKSPIFPPLFFCKNSQTLEYPRSVPQNFQKVCDLENPDNSSVRVCQLSADGNWCVAAGDGDQGSILQNSISADKFSNNFATSNFGQIST